MSVTLPTRRLVVRFNDNAAPEALPRYARNIKRLNGVTAIMPQRAGSPTEKNNLWYYVLAKKDHVDQVLVGIRDQPGVDQVHALYQSFTVRAYANDGDQIIAREVLDRLKAIDGIAEVQAIPHMEAMDDIDEITFSAYAIPGQRDLRDIYADIKSIPQVKADRVWPIGMVHL